MNTWTTEHNSSTGVSRVTFPGGRITVEIHLGLQDARAYTLKDGTYLRTDLLEGFTPAEFTGFLQARALEAQQLAPFKQ